MAEAILSTMAEEEVFEGLVQWLYTFGIEAPLTAEQLSSGVQIAEVLGQIDGEAFDSAWMSKLTNISDSSNWKIKLSNLKRILKGIVDYYEQKLGQSVSANFLPDLTQVAEHNSLCHLNLLLQLILGLVVYCDKKEEYIQRIMTLEESVQHIVMCAIQDLQKNNTVAGPSGQNNPKMTGPSDEAKILKSQNEELEQKCYHMDQQISQLQDQVASLANDNERLQSRLTISENPDDPGSAAGRQIYLLKQKADDLQNELFRMDSGKEEQRIRAENLEKENKDLLKRIEEMSSLEEENRSIKDEADELRSKASDAQKYQSTLDNYKKRLEEMSDLKIQVKILEEKNSAYMKSAIDLEEEVRKNGVLKTQFEAYKAQVQELQMKLTDEIKRADKAEFDAKLLQEKMDALTREKERVMVELDTVKELKDDLELNQLHSAGTLRSWDCKGRVGEKERVMVELDTVKELKDDLELNQLHSAGTLRSWDCKGRVGEKERVMVELDTVKELKDDLELNQLHSAGTLRSWDCKGRVGEKERVMVELDTVKELKDDLELNQLHSAGTLRSWDCKGRVGEKERVMVELDTVKELKDDLELNQLHSAGTLRSWDCKGRVGDKERVMVELDTVKELKDDLELNQLHSAGTLRSWDCKGRVGEKERVMVELDTVKELKDDLELNQLHSAGTLRSWDCKGRVGEKERVMVELDTVKELKDDLELNQLHSAGTLRSWDCKGGWGRRNE